MESKLIVNGVHIPGTATEIMQATLAVELASASGTPQFVVLEGDYGKTVIFVNGATQFVSIIGADDVTPANRIVYESMVPNAESIIETYSAGMP